MEGVKDTLTMRAGDVVFVVPRSMFRSDIQGFVQVGEHQVPAQVIYAAWAVGADQGLKVGMGMGAGLTLLALGMLVLVRRLWFRFKRVG